MGEATRVSLYDNMFSCKIAVDYQFARLLSTKTTGGAIGRSKKLVVSANDNEHQIVSSNRKFPPDEGGETRNHRLANRV